MADDITYRLNVNSVTRVYSSFFLTALSFNQMQDYLSIVFTQIFREPYYIYLYLQYNHIYRQNVVVLTINALFNS